MKHILMIVLVALMMGGCGAGKSSVQTANGTVTTVGVEEFAKVISKKRRWAYRMETKEHWSGLPFPSPMHESEK